MKFSSSLKLNHIFQRLYHTKGAADGLLVLYARKNRTEANRVGITVSKKLGKAHIRNRARRRLREVYRLNEEKFTPPSGSWEDEIKAVDAAEGAEGQVQVYLTWRNGQKTQHPLETCYKRCPQKVFTRHTYT